ncbi:hypothetical protein KC19_6G049300 [Ceratodon purpureus]|uniref:Uncharacterized protein n=1 Tax=Ceratodon purpureus TaxID=3225 RepID=A0A8T0HAQ9_CERPU|nr:hypothetical protein KC19_6G049300 [Ceratodon purpureus]
MADPLFTPALVGSAVNLCFTAVLNAIKSAYGYKKKCEIVLASVDKLQPRIDAAIKDSVHWDEDQSNWLKEIEDLLSKARSRAIKVRDETKSEKAKRVFVFWRWGKLPSELMNIVQEIESAKLNVVFVAALETMTYMNSLRNKTSLGFVPQQLPAHIVGVAETFNKLKASILGSTAEDMPSYLGLHGRGGAGKTTIAKMLHNDEQIKKKYGADSVLWITIGLDARVSDVYKTMGQFLAGGVFEKSYAHQSLEDQRRFLWNAYSKKKVFLILDDIWQENHEQNHDIMYWLNIATAPGSATLITTRNTEVLSKVHAESEVVLGLSKEDSWKLFSAHAFSEGSPPSTINQELAKEVCKECKGLPLALKVIGSAMVDKVDEEEWSSALHDLKQSKPILGSCVDFELFDCLRFSYDNLKSDVLRICFLYLAAFPEDYRIPTSKLFMMWDIEGLFGSVDAEDVGREGRRHLGILEKRSLIQWHREREYVQVHDILRDLALYIIDKAKPEECANECFFHSGKVFKSFPSAKSLQAIKRMSFMNSSISEWPQKFEAPNLQVCILSGMKMGNNGSRLDFLKDATKLKCLDLSRNHFNCETNLLCLERLHSLRYIDLSNNKYLEKLPANFGNLKHLTKLDLSTCTFLKKLPKSISNLESLHELHLSGCIFLKELPQNIGNLKHLTKLDLSRCRSLDKLPQSISNLESLHELHLSECFRLKELPENIGNLKHLRKLYLGGCTSLDKLPESISNLEGLHELHLLNCVSLKELPKNIGNLKHLTKLYLGGCKSLEKLPQSISNLESLHQLHLLNCVSLKELPKNIGNLKHLTKLYLGGCKSLEKLPQSISNLESLHQLHLLNCVSLKELPENIGNLKHLTKLNIVGCTSLEKLPQSISNLESLHELHLLNCVSLKELPKNIGNLKHLTELNIAGCKSLEKLPQSLRSLRRAS